MKLSQENYVAVGTALIIAMLFAPFPFNGILVGVLLAYGMLEGNIVR